MLAVALVVAAALVAVVPATIATPSATPIEKRLQNQVTTLQAQMKKVQKDLKNTRLLAQGIYLYTACSFAVVSDAFQGTWSEFDQKFPGTFGAQQAIDDKNLCSDLKVPRRQQLPPNNSAFITLFNTFTG
jgi:hypothetical protein